MLLHKIGRGIARNRLPRRKPVSIAITAVAAAATVTRHVANSKPRVRIRRPSRTMGPRGGNEDDQRMDEECMSARKTVEESHTGFLGSGLGDFGWPARNFHTELLGVLHVQPLPAAELHGLGADNAADGSSAENAIQNIETNVPPGSTH